MRKSVRFCIITLVIFLSLSIKPVFSGCSDISLKDKSVSLKWIAYAPTNYNPDKNIFPSEESIRIDLELLHKYGFNGVITYGALGSLGRIPQIASQIGFCGMIMGIWDIDNREEVINAVLARQFVDGYCVGNEGLNYRYDLDSLRSAIIELKHSTNKPVTTSEQIFDYSNENVFSTGDWIFPNIHPFLSKIRDPNKAAQWVEKHYQLLKKHCPQEKFILFKETGWPTAGANEANERHQKEFFIDLEKLSLPFVYFEAFDQPWKGDLAVEPHWGLFKSNRKPKKFMQFQIKQKNS